MAGVRRRTFVGATTLVGAAAATSFPVWARQQSADVIVIGAGLAGLHATHLLEQMGLNVILLEASARVGGRVYTLDHLDSQPEAGANQVGMDYDVVRGIMRRLNVATGPNTPMLPGMSLAINDQLLASQNWPKHAANRLTESDRSLQPNFLLWSYLAKEPVLNNAEEWLDKSKAHLDIPLVDYLRRLGATEEAIRLMNMNFMGEDVAQVSALQMIRKHVILKHNRGAEFIAGGTQRLPDAMAAALKTPVRYDKRVQRIEQGDKHIRVLCDDKSDYIGKRCIVAAPFSSVRHMDLALPISPAKRQAIDGLGYSSVIHVLMRPKSVYWEDDGLSANMWTDTPLGMVFGQFDKAKGTQRVRAWIMGTQAQALDALPPKQIGQTVLQALEKMRPASRGKLELEEVLSWRQMPHILGAFAYFKAGDITGFAHALAPAEGRLHFAGEHTDFRKSGMEAAVLSAERAVAEIKGFI